MKKQNWKRELVEKKMREGDTRSYNQLMADLELQLWHERMQGNSFMKKSFPNNRKVA